MELRISAKLCFKSGKNASETNMILKTAFDDMPCVENRL